MEHGNPGFGFRAIATAALLGSLLASGPGDAQVPWKPARPVEFVSPAAPGGSVDLMIRLTRKIAEEAKLYDVASSAVYKTGANGGIGVAPGSANDALPGSADGVGGTGAGSNVGCVCSGVALPSGGIAAAPTAPVLLIGGRRGSPPVRVDLPLPLASFACACASTLSMCAQAAPPFHAQSSVAWARTGSCGSCGNGAGGAIVRAATASATGIFALHCRYIWSPASEICRMAPVTALPSSRSEPTVRQRPCLPEAGDHAPEASISKPLRNHCACADSLN